MRGEGVGGGALGWVGWFGGCLGEQRGVGSTVRLISGGRARLRRVPRDTPANSSYAKAGLSLSFDQVTFHIEPRRVWDGASRSPQIIVGL